MKKFRIILDIIMTVLYIIFNGILYNRKRRSRNTWNNNVVLFIIHNILNIKWYKSIFKGKHSFQRTFHIVIIYYCL